MRFLKSKLILLLFVVFLFSCEREAQVYYRIENNSTYRIKVVFNDKSLDKKNDSMYIQPDSLKTIARHGQGLSSVDNYKEKGDKFSEFLLIESYKNDTIKSKKDLLKIEYWKYDELNVHEAEYLLII